MGCRLQGWRLWPALLVIIFLAGPVSKIQAEETRTHPLLTTETFFDFESLSNPSISPDGQLRPYHQLWQQLYLQAWFEKYQVKKLS